MPRKSFNDNLLYKTLRKIRGSSNVNIADVKNILEKAIQYSQTKNIDVRIFPMIKTQFSNNQCSIYGVNKTEIIGKFPCKYISDFDGFDISFVELLNGQKAFINGKFEVLKNPLYFENYKSINSNKGCNWINHKFEKLYNDSKPIFYCTEFANGFAYFTYAPVNFNDSSLGRYTNIYKIDSAGNISLFRDRSNNRMADDSIIYAMGVLRDESILSHVKIN